jgi:branched-chain amino acid transport system ATP-binding protein
MLAIGIALVKRPRLLLLDEPSLGLAPVPVRRLMDATAKINRQFRTAVLVTEQNVREALRIAQRTVVVHTGRVVLVERADTLGQCEDLLSLVIEGGRRAAEGPSTPRHRLSAPGTLA